MNMHPSFIEKAKKHIIVTGHYGSGKTNTAVNLALAIAGTGKKTAIVDLDIVNPYFRTADSREILEAAGVYCIIPMFANSNVDIPTIGAEVGAVFVENSFEHVVFDVGGDNGAVALGMFSQRIADDGYDMLCVINKYRPLTDIPESTAENLAEIEKYSRLKHTGIINNSNLGGLSDAKTMTDSFGYADETARICRLPLLFTALLKEHSDGIEALPGEYLFMRNVTKQLF